MAADPSLLARLPVTPIPLCWSSSKSSVSLGHVPGSLHVRVQWCPEQMGRLLWEPVLCGQLRGQAEPPITTTLGSGLLCGLARRL